ncbi:DUF6011 domain-containing protein [Marinactinospora rubrisoli]|uniref:DUF6011 domain-containing protein n=1 Tax=Marinactinospora rubrisoli TaxID=2715399 RepID=A0ABW2KN38_9ACTN
MTRCRYCNRPLRSARSIALGYGPTCRARALAEARAKVIAQHKPTTIERAQELIEDGGIVPLRGNRVWRVVSTDGSTTHKTAGQVHAWTAGLRGRHTCYHRVAAQLVALAA